MFGKTVAALSSATTFMWSLHAAALGDVTIYDNAQSVPVGGRAAGMGGAYTALACDEGALHYNPASLSCAAASHLELTANAYVLQGLRATGALGSGRNVSATTYPQRLTFGFRRTTRPRWCAGRSRAFWDRTTRSSSEAASPRPSPPRHTPGSSRRTRRGSAGARASRSGSPGSRGRPPCRRR